ncbi:hypothetical protein MYG64_07430 [Ensifer adhaerens]|uniref:hypothetical protein n=1 Tax=Ensifer adhaerens TaxID=106592 RepID=UPI002101031E|nr:hypothetical protein [Ensifer adhaerens]UTV38117.1 hypothetical protein MYG64_07430 [Ensifer adhaerens]
MPQIISFAALVVSSIATTVAGANLLYLGTLALGYAGLAYGAALLQGLLVDKPAIPKPEDGAYNLKQSVPSLPIVLGRRKKGSDYLALEERRGTAYHILCAAGHRVQGFVEHYLHDEKVTLNGDGYTIAPGHFNQKVRILTRNGLASETAYEDLVTTFPEIWTNAHRGDGLATVRVSCKSVSSEDHLKVYPNQMPQHSSVIDGALVFDPRDPGHDLGDADTFEFSRNIPLLRMHQLTNPWGGKLNLADLYMPEWAHAADVGDQAVTNRDGVTEPRYHGGIWFRANSDQVQVGRLLDQAAELVVYERPDGLIGVHAGEFVEPDIRLTEDDIHRLTFKANRSEAATVLAVRGRYTAPENRFNTVDAAIHGNPYVGEDTERTRTLDNQVIERHNHCQRLQKITMIRANAPRVSILATYEAAGDIGYKRFVRVHAPPLLDEAIVEIISTPVLSLRNLTVEFSGIVVPPDLYDFDAVTEEGEPPTIPEAIVPTGVPLPENFDVEMKTEVVAGGQTVAYALATWDFEAEGLIYEFEWQPSTETEPPRSAMSKENEVELRSAYLSDGKEYRFRLRTWANGVSSDWTDYLYSTSIADPVAPVALSSFVLSGASPQLGRATFNFATANDTRLNRIALYRAPAGVPLDKTAHAKIEIGAAPGTTFAYVVGDATRTNMLTNGDFGAAAPPPVLGTGWTVSAGKANHAAGSTSNLAWTGLTFTAGVTYRYGFLVDSISGVGAAHRAALSGGGGVVSGSLTGTGQKLGSLVATGNTGFNIEGNSTTVSQIDNVVLFAQTAACAPQGAWDYYAIPLNGSGVEGPQTGPVTVTII